MHRTRHRPCAALPTVNGGHEQPTEAPARASARIEALLWSLEEAALALRLSARTLKRAAAEGALPEGAVVRPFGRRRLFVRRVLEKWIAEGCPAVRGGRRVRR